MKELATEVVIVGAGPSGLVLANDLCRRGISFLLIDRTEIPPQESRALFLQARSLEALEDLGVLHVLLEKGILIEKVRLYENRKLEAVFELETVSRREAAYPYLLVVEQHVTESVLLQKLRQNGVQVERGWELSKLQNEPDQVRSWLRTPRGTQLVRSDYLVGCDGGNSQTRLSQKIEFTRTDFEFVYQLVDLELDWQLPPNEVIRLVDGRSEVVATPLPGKNRYRLSLWSTDLAAAPLEFSGWEQTLRKLSPCDFTLSNPRCLKSYRAGQGIAQSFRQGRVFLAGDAAHVIPQGMAQGLNLGLQDTYNLGWKLALVLRGEAPSQLLESYQRERRPVASAALANPSQPLDPGHWMSFLESRDELDRWSKLDLSPRRGPRRGDRAPDGELQSGFSTHFLYDQLRGLRYQLLVFSDRRDPNLENFLKSLAGRSYFSLDVHRIGLGPEATLDVDACLHRSYAAMHGDLVLIRPDRVLALRASIREGGRILKYLAEHLVESTTGNSPLLS